MNKPAPRHFAIILPATLLLALSAQAQTIPAGAPGAAEPAPAAAAPAADPSPAVQIPTPAIAQPEPAPVPKVQQVSSLEEEMTGGIDWEANMVYAVGDGVPPPTAASPAQARARAKRAALDEAMAGLLESIGEVRVDAESTTRDFINEHRAVGTRVTGLVKNAEVEEIRQFDDGSYQVKMRMPIHDQKGLSSTMLPTMLNQVQKVSMVSRTVRTVSSPAAAAEPVAASAETGNPAAPSLPHTALIIDATGVGVSPAMFPRILSNSGEVLYDLSAVDPNVAVLEGICAYRKSLDKAKQDQRAGSNPLVVKATDAAGSGRSDIVLADADVAAVADLGAKGLLREAKVIVVTE